MKNVLVITYFFPPANSVAGYRVASWINEFKNHGLFPTVVTRHWSAQSKNWTDFSTDSKSKMEKIVTEGYTLIRLPSKKMLLKEIASSFAGKLPLMSKAIHFILTKLGHFNTEADARASFQNFLFAHLENNNYDLIVVSSPPINLIRLASELNKRFKIPFVVDFRDLWNNEYLKENYVPSGKQKTLDTNKIRYITKWLSHCRHVTTVSKAIADALQQQVYPDSISVITNGYNEQLFNGIVKERSPYFSICMIGTFYPKQNLDLIFEGIRVFLKDVKKETVQLKFIGVTAIPEIGERVKKEFYSYNLTVADRSTAEDAAQACKNADVLLHSGWKGYKGIYTTKIFDYLASGNYVLVAPGDDDVIDELINRTQAGKIATTVEEVAEALGIFYKEWNAYGKVTFNGVKQEIEKYSRGYLAKQYCALLGERLSKSNALANALIVAYYFPPCNGVPAWRPYSWYKYFLDNDIKPTVATRHWNGTENKWDDFIADVSKPIQIEADRCGDIYYLPSKKSFLYKMTKTYNKRQLPPNKLFYFVANIFGYLNSEIDAYSTFGLFLKSHLKRHQYNYIIFTYPPSNVARLISVVKKNAGDAKIIVDYRDLWNNKMLADNYKPVNFKECAYNKLNSFYSRQWLKNADAVTTIVDSFKGVIQQVFKGPVYTVYNGYEHELFEALRKEPSPHFRFNVVGSIYPEQDLSILIDGLQLFLKDKETGKVRVNFIGVDSIPEVSRVIKNNLPEEYIYISARVSKEEAIRYTKNAEVLYYSGWKGYRGIISTKAFDYIASGNRILIAPGDDDVLDELIISTKTGMIANTAAEFNAILASWYKEWEGNHSLLANDADKELIGFYSRKNQSKRMADFLKSQSKKVSK